LFPSVRFFVLSPVCRLSVVYDYRLFVVCFCLDEKAVDFGQKLGRSGSLGYRNIVMCARGFAVYNA
jgi:hypothetical protein